ncbi:hypothetical protein GCM10025795_43860 [Verticiella sediminum]
MATEVVGRLHAEIGRAWPSPDVARLLPMGGDAGEYVQLIRREDAKWRPVIERTGVRF